MARIMGGLVIAALMITGCGSNTSTVSPPPLATSIPAPATPAPYDPTVPPASLFLSSVTANPTETSISGGSGVPASIEEDIAAAEAFCRQLVTDRKTEQDAQTAAEEAGYTARIVSQDGESFMVTMDYSPSRVNFEIQDGIVVGCTVG